MGNFFSNKFVICNDCCKNNTYDDSNHNIKRSSFDLFYSDNGSELWSRFESVELDIFDSDS